MSSTTVFVPSLELGLSHPFSPQNQRGGGTLACGLGVGGVPIPTTGEKFSTLWWILIETMRIWIQYFSSMRIRIQGFGDQVLYNFTAGKNSHLKKNCNFLPLGLHEVRQSYRRSLQPREISSLFLFIRFILLSWIPRIRIQLFKINADPDPKHCQKGLQT
jgi:hypothetical protein